MSYSVDGASSIQIDFKREATGHTNMAADGKTDLRFIAWSNAGKLTLKSGVHKIKSMLESENNHHGLLDCFVLSNEPFRPSGTLKPNEIAANISKQLLKNKGWQPWNPCRDDFNESPIDLRYLQ